LLNTRGFRAGPLQEDTSSGWTHGWRRSLQVLSVIPHLPGKAVFYYLQEHLTCTNHYDKYIRTNLRDGIKKNSGTVGDLNLLLVAMLRQKGFTADPVLSAPGTWVQPC